MDQIHLAILANMNAIVSHPPQAAGLISAVIPAPGLHDRTSTGDEAKIFEDSIVMSRKLTYSRTNSRNAKIPSYNS